MAVARNRSLLEVRILQAYYTIVPPAGLLAAATAVELWVNNLPSQVCRTVLPLPTGNTVQYMSSSIKRLPFPPGVSLKFKQQIGLLISHERETICSDVRLSSSSQTGSSVRIRLVLSSAVAVEFYTNHCVEVQLERCLFGMQLIIHAPR